MQINNPSSIQTVAVTTSNNTEVSDYFNLNSIEHHSLLMTSLDDMAALLSKFARRTVDPHDELQKPTSKRDQTALLIGASEKVAELKDLLQKQKLNMRGWLAAAQKIITDISDLAQIIAEMRRSPDLKPEDRQKLDRALELLMQSEGKQKILAGVNATLPAQLFSEQLDVSPQGLRQAYRILVLTQLSETFLYRYLIETFSFNKRREIIDFLEMALACDIRSLDPSCTKQEFAQLQGILFQLRLLRSSDMIFLKQARRKDRRPSRHKLKGRKFLKSDENDYGEANGEDADKGEDLLNEIEDRQLINILLAGIEDSENFQDKVVETFQSIFKFGDLNDYLQFLDRLFRGFSLLPLELFPNLEARNNILNYLSESLAQLNFPYGQFDSPGVVYV